MEGRGGKRGTTGEGGGGNGDGGGKTEQMGQRKERTKGERYISGRTGSKQVHTLRGEGQGGGLSTEGEGSRGTQD